MLTYIISDLHLGATNCQTDAILHFLDTLPADTGRLVLLGDVLESTVARLSKCHWRVLSKLRKLSDRLELVWVKGNHDFDGDSIAHLVGAKFVTEYRFRSGTWQVLCVHGDVWDKFLTSHPFITAIADWCYGWLQWLSRKVAVSAKRSSKTFLRCVERVKAAALEFAERVDADVVICGHTHHAEWCPAPVEGPVYFNSGCWTDHHCHYVKVRDNVAVLEEIDVESIRPQPQGEKVSV